MSCYLYKERIRLKKKAVALQIKPAMMNLSTQVVKGDLIMDFNNNNLKSQITAAIQSDIFNNYEVGDKLPSESEYAKKFDVSRTTVQKAMKEVYRMNLITKKQGKGSFVKMKQPKVVMFNFRGFSDYVYEIGSEPVTKILTKNKVKLGNKYFLILRRLRSMKTEEKIIPLTLDESILDLTKYPELDQIDFEKNSLYKVLRERYKVFPATTNLRMSAITADAEIAHNFNCKFKEALLQAEGTVFDSDLNMVEKVRVVYSDYADFKLALGI